MKMSLPGLFSNTARALQTSEDEMACAMAYSLGELVDNLSTLKAGGCTVDEFFAVYVIDVVQDDVSHAESVRAQDYRCMRHDPAVTDL